MSQRAARAGEERIDDMTASVQLPLENIEYTIEQYLLAHGARLDPDTRLLLARIRDSVARIAVSCRRIEGREEGSGRAGAVPGSSSASVAA